MSAPSGPAPQPPPDVPADPNIGQPLTQYLRTFALWCRNMFNDKLNAHAALPGLMLQATDTATSNPPVYMFSVTSGGQATLATVALGGGQPNDPVLGPAVPIGGGGVGVIDGSNAAAGQIGETLSVNVAATSAITLSTGVAVNVALLSLPPGDWDVSGQLWLAIGVGGATAIRGSISKVSAGLASDSSIDVGRMNINGGTIVISAGGTMSIWPLGSFRTNLTGTTVYYLVTQIDFPSGTCTAYGNIWARRMR